MSLKLDGRADGAVDSREKLLEFCFDYCYWSVDPAHPHYASQEEVTAARVSFDVEAQTLVSRDLRLPAECFLLTLVAKLFPMPYFPVVKSSWCCVKKMLFDYFTIKNECRFCHKKQKSAR